MTLQLVRPLIWLDVETHDKCNPEDSHIIELGIHICYHDGRPDKTWCKFIKPGVPISPGATEVHHIKNEDVVDAMPFSYYAKNLATGMRDCDFGGYNIKFDLRVIEAEMKRAGVPWSWDGAFLADGLRLWQIGQPRTLSDAVREFLGRGTTDAHRALGDAEDARDVFLAQLERWQDKLPTTMKALHELCFPQDPNAVDREGKIVWLDSGQACLTFGKHARKPLRAVPRDYLEWVIGQSFPSDTKEILKQCLRGNFPTKQEKCV